MSDLCAPRVLVAGPVRWRRQLCARLKRAGFSVAEDDGRSRAEVLVARIDGTDLTALRPRAPWLLAVGGPASALFGAGADDVVPPDEPELLFRRVRVHLEQADGATRLSRLAEQHRVLQESLAEMAHDLRSPLHACIGHAELLATDPGLTQQQRRSAEASARQGTRALKLAERVLEAAGRPDGVHLQLASLPLQPFCEAALSSVRAAAAAKGITLDLAPPPEPVEILADGELLARLLDNLLANAIRLSPPGSSIELGAARAGPFRAELWVQDHGPGIAAPQLARILAGLGQGRGLRICRQIAERHGGELWAESEPGKGSRFVALLPIRGRPHRTRVLLLSDDADWRRQLGATLAPRCEVEERDPPDAALGEPPFELAILGPCKKAQRKAVDAFRAQAAAIHLPVLELPPEIGAAEMSRVLARLVG
jgi:signal transduction histidine kinase